MFGDPHPIYGELCTAMTYITAESTGSSVNSDTRVLQVLIKCFTGVIGLILVSQGGSLGVLES